MLLKTFAVLFAVTMILPEEVRDLFFDIVLPVAIALFMLLPMPFAENMDVFAALALDFLLLLVFMSMLVLLVAFIDGRTEKVVDNVKKHRSTAIMKVSDESKERWGDPAEIHESM